MTRLLESSEPNDVPATGNPSAWQYEFIEFGPAGLKKAAEAGLIPDNSLSNSTNVTLDFSLLRSEYGYNKFSGTRLPVNFSKIRAFYTFEGPTGRQLIGVSNTGLFRFNTDNDEFVSIGAEQYTIIATSSAGLQNIVVNNPLAFVVGDYAVVRLQDSRSQTVKIVETGLGGNPNNFRIETPLENTVLINTPVQKVVPLHGNDDEQVVIDSLGGVNELYFTNNVDRPKRYNGVLVTDIDGLPFVSFRCKSLVCDYARIVLLNTSEDDGPHPTRTRWCDIGAPNIWPETNFLDLLETPGAIVTGLTLAKDIVIYKTDSVVRFEYLGQLDQTWQATKLIENEGAVSPLSVVKLVNIHAFLGYRNFYLYDGSNSLTPIGTDIYDLIIGPREAIDPSSKARCFGVYSPITQEIWWFLKLRDTPVIDLPWDDGLFWDDGTGWDTGDPTDYIHAFRYKLSHNAWTIRQYTFNISALINGRFSSGLTYANAVITYSAANFSYLGTKADEREILVIYDGTDNAVLRYDFTSNTDNGTMIPWEFQTRDFSYEHYKIRLDRFDMMIGGDNATLFYSIDKGKNWVIIGDSGVATDLRVIQMWKQVLARTVRFKLSGVGFMQLEHFGFTWRRESLY